MAAHIILIIEMYIFGDVRSYYCIDPIQFPLFKNGGLISAYSKVCTGSHFWRDGARENLRFLYSYWLVDFGVKSVVIFKWGFFSALFLDFPLLTDSLQGLVDVVGCVHQNLLGIDENLG